jgi:hypothetical protein
MPLKTIGGNYVGPSTLELAGPPPADSPYPASDLGGAPPATVASNPHGQVNTTGTDSVLGGAGSTAAPPGASAYTASPLTPGNAQNPPAGSVGAPGVSSPQAAAAIPDSNAFATLDTRGGFGGAHTEYITALNLARKNLLGGLYGPSRQQA